MNTPEQLTELARVTLLYCTPLTDPYLYGFSRIAGEDAQHLRTLFIEKTQYYINSLCCISKSPQGPYVPLTQSERKKVSRTYDPLGDQLIANVSDVVTPWFEERYHGTPRLLAEGIAELYLHANRLNTHVQIDKVNHVRLPHYSVAITNIKTLFERGNMFEITIPGDEAVSAGFKNNSFGISDERGIELTYPDYRITIPLQHYEQSIDAMVRVMALLSIITNWPMEHPRVAGMMTRKPPQPGSVVEEGTGDELEHWQEAILRRIEHMLNLPEHQLNRLRITHGMQYTHLRASGPSEKLDIYLQEGADTQVCVQSSATTIVFKNEELGELVRRGRVVLDNRIAASITNAILSNPNPTNLH